MMLLMKEEIFVTTKFGKLYYLESGAGSKSILYFHGGMGRPDFFNFLANYFDPKQYRIVAPYLPSHGKSFSIPENFKFSDLINVMIDFINQLGLNNITLVGHSFGGLVALGISNKKKEIKKLVLSSTPLGPIKKNMFEAGFFVFLDYIKDHCIDTPEDEKIKIEHIYEIRNPQWLDFNKIWKLIKTFEPDEISLNKNLQILFLWGEDDSVVPLKDQKEAIMKYNGKLLQFSGHHYWKCIYPKTFLRLLEEFTLK